MPHALRSYGATDVGLKRGHNEDFFLANDELGLYLVADGMGGHAAGEVASHTAINTIGDFVSGAKRDKDFTWPFGVDHNMTEDENLLVSAIKIANREICVLAEEKIEYHGMGTTIACLKVDGDQLIVAHVGDSRVYRVHSAALEQLTVDHSWVNEQVARNLITEEEARTHRWRNVITRALGNKDTIEVDVSRLDIVPGNTFLMCSDGLSGMLNNEDIRRILSQAPNTSLETIAQELITRANEAGGQDNITVLLLHVAS
ncbi:MAG: Stp1/IreP family PP2C-type Ser/Thr phosphatase [Candidatus Sumerlaeota bacterium]|nr:Stp1/IreP family PP2C-type Ser/Thr phosphatase [Candidatus Sumerlaeota bacterium]